MFMQNLGLHKFCARKGKKRHRHMNRCRLWIHMNSTPNPIDIPILSFLFLLARNFVQSQILHEHRSLHHLCIRFLVEFSMHFLVVFFLGGMWEHFKGGEALELLSGRGFRAQYQPTRQIHCNLCVVPDLVMIITLSGTGSQRSCSLRFLNSFNIL